MLQLSNLNTQILKELSFTIKEDENLIILGSNGAGKSTLAKVLCGLIPSQNISLFGKQLLKQSAKERARLLNYIPPKLEMFDEYISVREYLELSLLYSKKTLDEVLELLKIETMQNKRCKHLSSGEEQLTMMAASILHNAKLTIFDEPTANLDPQKTLQIFEILKSDLLGQKIIITHDLNLAYKLGFKILYLKDGTVEFLGENEAFFEEKNLKKLFGESVKKVDNYFAVNL